MPSSLPLSLPEHSFVSGGFIEVEARFSSPSAFPATVVSPVASLLVCLRLSVSVAGECDWDPPALLCLRTSGDSAP